MCWLMSRSIILGMLEVYVAPRDSGIGGSRHVFSRSKYSGILLPVNSCHHNNKHFNKWCSRKKWICLFTWGSISQLRHPLHAWVVPGFCNFPTSNILHLSSPCRFPREIDQNFHFNFFLFFNMYNYSPNKHHLPWNFKCYVLVYSISAPFTIN